MRGNGVRLVLFISRAYHFKEIGEHALVKTKIEEVNEEKRCVEYSHHGGLMMDKYYKTFKSKFQVTPKKEGCIVKWSFEYEKINENISEPKYIDFLLGAAKDVDACLCSV
ncbi:hypothetical protein BVRB_1g012010 [Beta vulgaris subsp. vulgaris]|nr:hypothetical protein BVRB_1g012010 [Beta vulgaris subsp. vulgaris]